MRIEHRHGEHTVAGEGTLSTAESQVRSEDHLAAFVARGSVAIFQAQTACARTNTARTLGGLGHPLLRGLDMIRRLESKNISMR